MDIKDINLSEEDFKTIFDALECLPERGAAGSILGGLMGTLIPEGKVREEYEKRAEQMERKRQREKEILTENVRLLQGKLIMLKRHMIENDLLRQAKESL